VAAYLKRKSHLIDRINQSNTVLRVVSVRSTFSPWRLEDQGIVEEVILQWILRNKSLRMRNGLTWPKVVCS
jgi:hypothetical protein